MALKAIEITARIIALLKKAGIDYSKMAGKIDPNKISQLITKTQETATKPKLIDALNKKKATYQQALDIFENDAKYLSFHRPRTLDLAWLLEVSLPQTYQAFL